MANQEIKYQSLNDIIFEERHSQNDVEDIPENSSVILHTVPETSVGRWNHIKDLDSFFTRTYNYHQKHGLTVIVLDEVFQLLEFSFVIWILTFTVNCIKHSVLFGNTPAVTNYTKVTLSDVIIPTGECVDNFSGITFFVLFLSTMYFMVQFVKMIYNVAQYADIKKFYNSALNINDSDLDNVTWHEVNKRIRAVQAEQHMCIDKEHLTELDIYHRILRFKNYMVAMMNKNLIPVKFYAPLLGEVVSLSHGLMFNIDFILFRAPGSPFHNNWKLRDDYTVRSNQIELAQRLSHLIMWVAIFNLIMAPIIFFWQIIHFSFAYANILRKEPGTLGMRTWSNYGRLYFRHFNELEHELNARLNRAYQHADKYLSSFSSPVVSVIAKNLLFVSGGLLILLLSLGIYEEFVFQIEHVLTIITVLSAIGLVCRMLLPDENLIWCPEQLMTAILAHVHYLPSEWKNQAHTAAVRKEFGNFFQFKAVHIICEICSPLITPFILMFAFRPKAIEIVKFFRSFTVSVKGVGNVCSFAQMNVRKYGNPDWQFPKNSETIPPEKNVCKTLCYPTANGKTELSLLRFTLTNPEWHMPEEALMFIKRFRQNAVHELKNAKLSENVSKNAMTESLLSFGTMGQEYFSIVNSVLNVQNNADTKLGKSNQQNLENEIHSEFSLASTSANREIDFEKMLQQNLEDTVKRSAEIRKCQLIRSSRKLRVYKTEGRLEGPSESLLYSISNLQPTIAASQIDVTAADMCLSALYLHEVHRRNKKLNSILSGDLWGQHTTGARTVSSAEQENMPLLGITNL